MGDAGQLKGLLIIITVLQLDWLCKKKKKKKEKWAEVPYVLLFLSARHTRLVS